MGVDDSVVQAIIAAVGPVGVCVLASVWMLTRKRENGTQTIRLTKIGTDVGNLKDTTGEIKEDLREVRQAVTQHLQDHSS